MDIPKQYDPTVTEDKWYSEWMRNDLFSSVPDEREPFTIVIPPPNVTGVLHMGHMLNNTLQDVLIRRARMKGKNACWVPGTDHASIATEAKVVAKLKAEGIEKSSLTRAEFLDHAMQWKDKHGGIILEQLKKLGAACDWKRTKFTMDPDMSAAVIDAFIDLYNKGLVYRGVRMINWDPSAQTALSDEEVIYKENPAQLYYVAYKLEGTGDTITIATTRPETILGDTAICVHPDDSRFSKLVGTKAIVPLVGRAIPIIADEYVDMTFGTGALKITPAHDINDYNLGLKHKLPVIDVIAPDGKMSDAASIYIGEDRFAVRKKIIKDLESEGHLVKTEEIINKVGHSERTDAVIEPRLSLQWFVNMQELAGPALEVVLNGRVQLHPAKFVNTYKHWMENVKDWCISRQLWWGQQIPAWYNEEGDFVVARTADDAVLEFNKLGKPGSAESLRQDEDVLDTWFSSWLWPITVFDAKAIGKPKSEWNEDLRYYYPTNDLVTAPEILFFWVARMIMAGMIYCDDIPFSNVYLTGIVRDKQGRKMSKSLGNSPDPIDLIKKYGADGVRIGMLLTSPAGNDLPFDESLCEQGRNFNNKLWNAFRLVSGWESDDNEQPQTSIEAIEWFESKLQFEKNKIEDLFSKYRISEALMTLYKLVWDDYCAWFLEAIKPPYQQAIDNKTKAAALDFMKEVLRLTHPFAPFITEEIWSFIKDSKDVEFILNDISELSHEVDEMKITDFELVREVVTAVRNFRNEKGISPKESIKLYCKSRTENTPLPYAATMKKLGNINEIEYTTDKPEQSFMVVIRTDEFFIPAGDTLDLGAEKAKLEKELEYTKGFLNSVKKKLDNERFMANAKADVVDIEKQKFADAVLRINILEDQIKALQE